MPVLLLICMSGGQVQAFDKLLLDAPLFAPFTYVEKNGQLAGKGIVAVTLILDKLGVEYQFRIVANYGVGFHYLRNQQSDGFCLATRNDERDLVGQLTLGVMMNDWAWFYLADASLTPESNNFKQIAKIGSQFNTNTFHWLKSENYQVASLPNEATTLVRLLFKKRIDAVFLSADVFWYGMRASGYDVALVRQKTQISQPFGCYFSHQYLKRNPTFLARFNQLAAIGH